MDLVTLQKILELIERHGLSVVLLVISIIGWVYILKWLGKRFDSMWMQIVSIRRDVPDSSRESVEKVVSLNIKVNAILREAMVDTGAGWVQLWQFHNGIRGLGRGHIPFLYMSLTHEICDKSLPEMRTEFAHLPLSMFENFAPSLIENDLIIHDDQMTNPNGSKSGMGRIMRNYKAKTSFMRTVREEDGDIIGFIAFVFCKSTILSADLRNAVLEYGQRVAAMMATLDGNKGE